LHIVGFQVTQDLNVKRVQAAHARANGFAIMNKFLLVFDYFWQLVGLFDPIGCFD
jgi:hypothetical protein